ncbi:MAG: WYL domain-containing protein [Alphaproteobacteria bacterium]|nr:WYL domain-containing protein [Alphaproteobacteria bacterium]
MSFGKAEQLLSLAVMAASRHAGITLGDVMERYGCSRRTAQRMLHILEYVFPDTLARFDDDGRKRWLLHTAALRDLLTLTADELATMDLAAATLSRLGQFAEADKLLALKEKLLALVPRSRMAGLETDYEALLEAQGLAARPGPRPKVDPAIADAVSQAIKACRLLEIDYRPRGKRAHRRSIAPYGVLVGQRRYIVARAAEDLDGPMRLFRHEAILRALVTEQAFVRDAGFSLRAFANRAFGVFQNECEYGEVVWRFLPEAAAHAREFEFHPEQVLEPQKDKSLIVRFQASGHLEMCWYLYAWGDKVEVLAPEPLKRMVDGYRRGDFAALP